MWSRSGDRRRGTGAYEQYQRRKEEAPRPSQHRHDVRGVGRLLVDLPPTEGLAEAVRGVLQPDRAAVCMTFTEICEHGERFFACPTCWPVEPELLPAFRGLAGDFVRSFALHSEAHPVALLGTFLTLAGNRFGPRAHINVGAIAHPGRLFFVPVGVTSVGRKGQSWAEAASVFEAASPCWAADFVYSGFGSGEGLIARVSERMESTDEDVVHDPRLVVHEAEFASLLRVAGRDGSILSSTVRDAWDGKALQNNVRKGRIVARAGHMVSLVAHVTADELRRELTRTDIANGFANRFMFAGVHRTRRIAHPKTLDPTDLAAELNGVCSRAAGVGLMRFTDAGADAWTLAYDALEDDAESAGGIVGPLLARGSAQALRLSVVYALLDGSDRITAEHVEAAVAFWRYCAASVRDVFGAAIGNAIADRIAEAVGAGGLTRTEISEVLGRHCTKAEIDVAIDELTRNGRYSLEVRTTDGRSATVLLPRETSEVSERRGVG